MRGGFARVAWRSLRDLLGLRAWQVAFLMPLICVGLFIVIPGIVIATIQHFTRRVETGGAPSRDTLVISLAPGADPATQALFDELGEFLLQDPHPSRGAEDIETFMKFLGSHRVPHAPRDFSTEKSKPPESPGLTRYIDVEVIVGVPSWKEFAGLVPKEYDAALMLTAIAPGRARYRIAWDPASPTSNSMRELVEQRIARFVQARRDASPGRALSMALEDHVPAEPDFWLVKVGALLMFAALLMTYQSIGIQAATGLLAGEREARTLEVLLSLPVTLRQVLWAKLVATVVAAMLPVVFWGLWPWLLLRWLGIDFPIASVAVLAAAVLTFECSIACGVSASSPTTAIAARRLSVANLVVGGVVAGLGVLPWVHPAAALSTLLAGGMGSAVLVVASVGVLGLGAVVALELGRASMRRS